MSLLGETRRPPFFAAIYTTPPEGYRGYDYREAASLLVALAANEPGYLGYEAEDTADTRDVAVCYWDSYAAMVAWLDKAGDWIPASLDMAAFICATGCLWPWQEDQRGGLAQMTVAEVA